MILEAVFADEREQALECGAILFESPTREVCVFGPLVYGLCDPRSPRRIRYVGQTEAPRQRYDAHCYPHSAGGRALIAWLKSLREARVYPTMLLLDWAETRDRLLGVETRWILRLRARGMADLNRAPVRHTIRLSDRDWRVTRDH